MMSRVTGEKWTIRVDDSSIESAAQAWWDAHGSEIGWLELLDTDRWTMVEELRAALSTLRIR